MVNRNKRLVTNTKLYPLVPCNIVCLSLIIENIDQHNGSCLVSPDLMFNIDVGEKKTSQMLLKLDIALSIGLQELLSG